MPDVDRYPPMPLPGWQSAWRYAVAAVPAGVICVAWLALGLMPPDQMGDLGLWRSNAWYLVVDLALGAFAFWLMRFRRRRPVLVGVATALCCLASFSAAGPATVCLASVATRRRWSELAIVTGVVVAVSLTTSLVSPFAALTATPPGWGGIVLSLLSVIAVVLVGLYVGARRDLLASLRDRAETAEREQALRVQQARTTERTRIAREMHDVMAHRVSLVSMHAGALAFRDDLTPDETRAAAAVIQQNAHQALVELRSVLGALRAEGSTTAPPQPTLAGLADLFADAHAAGQRIESECSVEVAGLPERVSRDAYRVVQEGLTNARKHAPGALVRVQLRLAEAGEEPAPDPGEGESDSPAVEYEGWLVVRLSNPRPVEQVGGPGARLGLIGLRERVELAGGRLQHCADASGHFRLEAWLPW